MKDSIYCEKCDKVPDEDRANARLIASAPELLEVCKDFVAYDKKSVDLRFSEKIVLLMKIASKMEQAIAKAEGDPK